MHLFISAIFCCSRIYETCIKHFLTWVLFSVPLKHTFSRSAVACLHHSRLMKSCFLWIHAVHPLGFFSSILFIEPYLLFKPTTSTTGQKIKMALPLWIILTLQPMSVAKPCVMATFFAFPTAETCSAFTKPEGIWFLFEIFIAPSHLIEIGQWVKSLLGLHQVGRTKGRKRQSILGNFGKICSLFICSHPIMFNKQWNFWYISNSLIEDTIFLNVVTFTISHILGSSSTVPII